ncbi:extracellular superoxide dismutase [Cu-Zn] [Nematolebias whitei]|uniref:extracellular superoxide dismutase [Cu-Zn] n=1 Tax=Nematolebias whitei TaxID=451745 RepID=UPI00189C237E|nr:extracellular superoxide dismutase [Cu-Zn] [Nematolebias whitei]
MLLHWSVSLLVLLAGLRPGVSEHPPLPPEVSQHNGSLYAACEVRPSTSLPEEAPLKVHGQVLFKQEPQGKLQVLFSFSGFPEEGPPEPRAVHIHKYGDLSRGCDSTGGHYNPHVVDHPGHPGDFGNFVPQQGRISALQESEATLFGRLSVLGRAVVLHEDVDDMGQGGDAGSLLHGNSGRRLACCVIGISSPSMWQTQHELFTQQLL